MPTFVGTLFLPGEDHGVPFSASVAGQRLTLEVAGAGVGDWEVDSVRVAADESGVVLDLGEEAVTLVLASQEAFLAALQPRSVAVTLPPPPSKRRAPATRGRIRIPLPWLAVLTSAAAVTAGAIIVPTITGSVFLLAGIALLAFGAFAVIDVRTALRLPASLRPGHLLIVGIVAVALGGAVVVAG